MTVTPRPDSGIYQARVAGQRISLGTRSHKEARELARTANLAQLEKTAAGGKAARRALIAITRTRGLTLESAAKEWHTVSAACGRSRLTIDKNEVTLNHWFREAPQIAAMRPEDLNESHVSGWINTGTDGRGSRQRRLSVLRSFCNFLVTRDYSTTNPAANVVVDMAVLTHEQKESRPVLAFTAEEVAHLLKALPEGFWRDATAIGWATGLRIGDVIQLEWASFSEPGSIIVWNEKTRERVCLPITDRTTPGLADVLGRLTPGERYVFPEQARDFAFDASGRARYSVYFTRYAKSAGILGKSFHSLRRGRIQAWEAAGFSLDDCQRYAGHKSAGMTKRYLRART